MVMDETQYCPKCEQHRELDSYSPSKRGKRGTWCRGCRKTYRAAHYRANREKSLVQTAEYRRVHPEKSQEWVRRWREKHPTYAFEWQKQNPERAKAARLQYYYNHPDRVAEQRKKFKQQNPNYSKDWYIKNRERISEQGQAYYEANKERVRQRHRSWYAKNRDRHAVHWRKRRALKKGATIGVVDYTAIRERDRGLCYLCGEAVDPADLHFEHVIPLSRGGSHSMENIRVSHAACNWRKGTKTPEEL
jgi:5-methylcytosine-specific restriction endonuclease McrA